MMKNTTMYMTQGTIWNQLILFSAPLLLSELAQSFYNTVDSVVVGQFCGKAALAAVGSTGSVVRMLVGFFTGISVGCTVVVAQAFGKKDDQELHDAVHTIMSLSLILGVSLSGVGITITDVMLRLLETPEDVFFLASVYIRIYFFGLLGLVLFNTASGILQAVGDSKHPAQYLTISSVLNIVLDLVLVIGFSLGVTGVALATIISQFVSAVLALGSLMHANGAYRLNLRGLSINKRVLVKIFSNGIPIGI